VHTTDDAPQGPERPDTPGVLPTTSAVKRSGRSTAGVKDVAAKANVSLGTVSNVLNRPHLVSAATRTRVEQAMTSLRFVRNDSARQLRAGSSKILAYVMLDAGNPFFTDVAKGIEEAAQDAGLSLILCNSNQSSDREAGYLDLLEERRVRGVLITPVNPDFDRLLQLPQRGIPVVVVDRTATGQTHCSVAVNDVLGGDLAATHLFDLGHRHIAFVGGPATIGQVRDRLEGVQAAAARAGRPTDSVIHILTDALSINEGRSAAERIAGIPARRRPTAAFCANDMLALGLLQQCVTLGLRVPEDIAIVGYDDIEFAAAAAVPLTSVHQPRALLGRRATELLLDEYNNPEHEHQQILFTPELVVRASTHRPSQLDHGRTGTLMSTAE
jgi:LacI family transcriptional regulator